MMRAPDQGGSAPVTSLWRWVERGESLFAGIDLPGLGYRVTEAIPTELVTHVVLTR